MGLLHPRSVTVKGIKMSKTAYLMQAWTGAGSFGVYETLEQAKKEVEEFVKSATPNQIFVWQDHFEGRQITLEGKYYGIENCVIYQIEIGESYFS